MEYFFLFAFSPNSRRKVPFSAQIYVKVLHLTRTSYIYVI